MKKLLNLLACLALAAHLNACTSNDSKDESEGGSVAEDSLDTGGADASLEGASTDKVAENNDGFLDEQLPEDALGESTPEQEVAKAEPPPVVEETPAVTEAPAASTDPTIAETPAPVMDEPAKDSFAAVDTGSSTEPTPSDSALGAVASTTSTETSLASEDKPKSAPLKKVEAAPFKRAGVLANAVYIARPGDSFSSISKSIYGDESKTKELKKVNPYFTKVRPGDKVYYNSPVRPTDDTKLLTRYEDAGLIPETYVAKEGDDLKQVSKDLLGYDNAWKEIWTTNSVDSKGALAAGTELRYWKSAPAAALPPSMPEPSHMANNNPPPPAMNEALPPPPPVAQNDIPVPPASDMNAAPPPPAMNEALPPPTQAAQDLPPPPPAEAVNPPPPPPAPVIAKKAPKEPENIGGLDNDMIMTLGGAGILVAAIALLMIVRKRRQQKEMSAAFGDTHVGT